MRCPSHVSDYVLAADSKFCNANLANQNFFRLVCTCGCTLFNLQASNLCSLRAVCCRCNNAIVAYDLQFYPASKKLSGEEVFSAISSGYDGYGVYLMYEYGETDSDMQEDVNDLSWCQAFIELPDGSVLKVFDDEAS